MQYELADPGTVCASVFDDEIVVANFSTGVYYSLRFAAAEIWLGLMAGVPAEQVIRAIEPHCNGGRATFTRDGWTLVETLEAQHLIKPADRDADTNWAPRPKYQPYEAPAFESFTDM